MESAHIGEVETVAHKFHSKRLRINFVRAKNYLKLKCILRGVDDNGVKFIHFCSQILFSKNLFERHKHDQVDHVRSPQTFTIVFDMKITSC